MRSWSMVFHVQNDEDKKAKSKTMQQMLISFPLLEQLTLPQQCFLYNKDLRKPIRLAVFLSKVPFLKKPASLFGKVPSLCSRHDFVYCTVA